MLLCQAFYSRSVIICLNSRGQVVSMRRGSVAYTNHFHLVSPSFLDFEITHRNQMQGLGIGKQLPTQVPVKPFTTARCAASKKVHVRCQAEADTNRRQIFQLGVATAIATAVDLQHVSPAFAAKPPVGFTPIKDPQDGYTFLSPFGWQEVAVKGQDVVYKDVIEPLESVSVSITPTEKATIEEYGSPAEIAATLATDVLTPPNQQVKILSVSERQAENRKYVEFEFASKASTYIRHALASVCIANGKFYTLTTGSNEFRWEKMKDKLKTVVASFDVVDRY